MGDTNVFENLGSGPTDTTYWEDEEEERIEMEYRRGVTRQANGGAPATAHCTRDGGELKVSLSRDEGDEALFFTCDVCGRYARVEW